MNMDEKKSKERSPIILKEERQTPTPETAELINLFFPLARKYGKNNILNYIKRTTDIVSVVLSRWLYQGIIPSSGLRNLIIKRLRDFPANRFTYTSYTEDSPC